MRQGPPSCNPRPCQNFPKQKKEDDNMESIDLSTGKIRELFNKQIREMTKRTMDSFDYQFSDRWVP
jgi:hypothetical protein